MNQSRAIRWLFDQLPGLVQAGVLTPSAAETLRNHYAPQTRALGIPLAFLFFGVLGSLLIGAGIILLLAHNWQEMSRPVRAVVSLLPLVLAQAASARVLMVRSDSVAWREGAGLFHALSVGASIALIAQTYHMPGSFDSFMLTWMLLAFPLVYLLNAVSPLLLYFAGIVSWSAYQQNIGAQALLFWPLAAAVAPFVWRTLRVHPGTPRSAVVQCGAMLALTCALGIVLEKALPGLWIPVYACFFSVLYLAGGLAKAHGESEWLKPARWYGGIAGLVLAFLFTWSWPWREVGWYHCRWGGRFHASVAWADGVVALLLLALSAALLTTAIRRRRAWDLLIGSLAPVAVIGYAIASSGVEELAALWMNAYLVVLSVGLAAQGVRERRLRTFNAGLIAFSGLVVARFFDSDVPFIAKGSVFIALGVVFLVCNLVLARRKENPS